MSSSDIERLIKHKDEVAVALHTKVFSAWVTAQFRNSLRKYECQDVTKDLKNFELFNALVEVLCHQKNPTPFTPIPKHEKDNVVYRIENLSIVLTHLKKFMPIDIEPKDIEDGKKKVILGLIFQMILFFKLARLLEAGELEKGLNETPEQRAKRLQKKLLEFLQDKCNGYEGVEVKDLGPSFHDGKALCALVNAFDPNYLDYGAIPKEPEKAAERLNLAFQVAKDKMDIPALLEVADMTNPDATLRPDEQCIAAYLSEFPPVFLDKQEEIAKRLAAEKIEADRLRAEAEKQRLAEKAARRKAKEEAREQERKRREVELEQQRLAEEQKRLDAQKAYEKQRAQIAEERERNERELAEMRKSLAEEKNKADAQMKAKLEELEKQQQKLKEDAKGAREQYEQQLKQLNEERQRALAEQAKLVEEKQKLLDAKKAATEERKKLEQEKLEHETKVESDQKLLEMKQKDVEETAASREHAIKAYQKELDDLKSHLQKEKKDLEDSSKRLEEQRKLSDEEHAAQQAALQADIARQQAELDALREKLEEEKRKLEEAAQKLQIDRRNAEAEAERARLAQEQALKEAMERRRFLIDGVAIVTVVGCKDLKTKKADYASVHLNPSAKVKVSLVSSLFGTRDQSHATLVHSPSCDPTWPAAVSTFKYYVRSSKEEELECVITSHHMVWADSFLGFCKIPLQSLPVGVPTTLTVPLLPRKYYRAQPHHQGRMAPTKHHAKEEANKHNEAEIYKHKRGNITVLITWMKQD